jgi:hypothetical protein
MENNNRFIPQSSILTTEGVTLYKLTFLGKNQILALVIFNRIFIDKFSVGLNAQAMINLKSRLKTSSTFGEITVTTGAGSDSLTPDNGYVEPSDHVDSSVVSVFRLPIMYHHNSTWNFSLNPLQ